jgi:hypothetical protein
MPVVDRMKPRQLIISMSIADKLYVYPCEWNYRPDHCMYMSICRSAEKTGVMMFHGSRSAFQNEKQPAFKAIYQAFRDVSKVYMLTLMRPSYF